jgi:hypothetical protein
MVYLLESKEIMNTDYELRNKICLFLSKNLKKVISWKFYWNSSNFLIWFKNKLKNSNNAKQYLSLLWKSTRKEW